MTQITRFLIFSFSFLIWNMPRKIWWFKSRALAWLWFDVLHYRRYTILRGLTIAFPEKTHAERMALARTSLPYQCYVLPELLSLPQLNAQKIKDTIEFHGLENYEKALAQGRGVLMLSMHLGNGDVGVTAMALNGIKINLITRKAKSKFFNDLWFSIRGGQGVQFIDAHGVKSAHEILSACKRKECVIFVLDQYIPAPYGVNVPFFSRKTGTGLSLAKFALKLQAPVIPVWTYRDGSLKTHIVFDPEIKRPTTPVTRENQDQVIEEMTAGYNKILENIIRLYPEQWMWVHRRWKKFR